MRWKYYYNTCLTFLFFWNAWKISFVKSHSRGTFSYRGGVLWLKKEGKEKKKKKKGLLFQCQKINIGSR